MSPLQPISENPIAEASMLNQIQPVYVSMVLVKDAASTDDDDHVPF